MAAPLIRLQVAEGIATVTLDDPASRNGLSLAMQLQLLDTLTQLAGRSDIGALLLTGTGPAFCAGANLAGMDQNQGQGRDGMTIGQRGADMMEQVANPLIQALQAFPRPVVCAVNGAAAGAGMSIALAADIVLAARSAFFLAPFLPRLGILPDLGASWFLPRLAGRARTLGMMLLGERLPAEQACAWGLIWACVDDALLPQEAFRVAQRLARAPAHSALEARRALAAADGNDLAAQLAYEAQRQRELLDRPEFTEGVRAFFDKREPHFPRPAASHE
jgi:2-(1,2-epoxy-1,2-dihydrophenyl)acetyl-CoA isomerase